MKIMRSHLLYCGFVMILISCNPQQSLKQKADSTTRSVSNSYKPPVFDNDKRMEKIKDIATEIQILIEEHAKARNIPGIAYGIVVDNELASYDVN